MDTNRPDDVPVKVVDRRWWARGNSEAEPAADEPVRKPTVVEDLEQQLADARSRIQEVLSAHRQSLEEFEQVKTRLRRDVAREVERGRRVVLAELLEVVDNLDRAVSASADAAAGGSVEQLARGVTLVRDQFLAKLEGFGITRAPSLDQPFDAQRHEAVTTTPVAEPDQDGTVVAVVKEGYAIGGDVLRPASVVVGRYEG